MRIDHLSRVHRGARRRGVRWTRALAFVAAAALFAPSAGASADLTQLGAWSSGFNDSLWIGSQRSISLSPVAGWSPGCIVNCGPLFGANVVRRTELLSSNAADLSVNKTADSTGHVMAISGTIVTERQEPDGFGGEPGSPADWVVVGERTLDSNGAHSWSLLSPDISLEAHWLPIDLYRFEDASLSMNLAAGGAAPEASTWAMTLIGFAGLGLARYRSRRGCRRSIRVPKGMDAQ